MRFRIRVYDRYNFVTERCIEAHVITKGKNEGRLAEERWEVLGYYNRLVGAVKRLYDEILLEEGCRESGLEILDCETLLRAHAALEERIEAVLHRLDRPASEFLAQVVCEVP